MDISKPNSNNANTGRVDGRDNEALSFLVAQSSQGDREALIELCRNITRGVMFRSARILGDQTDAEDVTQEILIKVCTHIHELKEPAAFYVWLNSIIMNETNRYLSRNSKHGVLVNIEEYKNDIEEVNEEFLPHENSMRELDRRSVISIIDKLPEQQRKAVLLYYYDGLTLAESAKVMGVSQPRVSRCIKFAQDKIRKEFAKLSKGAGTAALGFAAIPLDMILAQALQQEAAFYAGSNAVISEGMISSFASNASGAGAAAGEAGSKASNASNTGNSAGTIATIAAAIAVSAGALIVTPMVNTYSDSPPAIIAEYEVALSGGAPDREYVNPKQAVAYAREGFDADYIKAKKWMITAEGANEAIYSGDGGVVDEVLHEMVARGESGIYIVSFEMEDEHGNTWILSRKFAVEASG